MIGQRSRNWGVTPEERELEFPCDRHLSDPDDAMYRAVTVDASAPIVFRWLCQLRVAPYSYDWIDNLGRRSPRRLTEGLVELEVGQRIMTIFRLAALEEGRSITLDTTTPLFGRVAVTYQVTPTATDRSRLVAKLAFVAPPRSPRRGHTPPPTDRRPDHDAQANAHLEGPRRARRHTAGRLTGAYQIGGVPAFRGRP